MLQKGIVIGRICQISFLGAIAIIVASCDLFSTRSTEPPSQSGSPWKSPTQVEQVFTNMTLAIAELNSDNYMRCLFEQDDTEGEYLFLPVPGTVGWPNLVNGWGYTEEKQAIEYLFSLMSPESPGYLAFSDSMQIVRYGNEDSIWVKTPYTLSVSVDDPDITMPQSVSGEADFYLAQNSIGYWAIYRCEDLGGSLSSPSWTELKAWLY